MSGVMGAMLRRAKRVASIRIFAIQKRTADEVADAIREEAPKYGCLTKGIVRLPTHIRRYTVNRSVFVNKKSQESFEMRRHKRLVEVFALDDSQPMGLVHALMERPPLGTHLTVAMHWEEQFEPPTQS
jgi:small subunit ribosomal protein S10